MKCINIAIFSFIVLMALICCASSRNDMWETRSKGEVYDVVFSFEQSNLIILTGNGLKCFDMASGRNLYAINDFKMYSELSIYKNLFFIGSHNKLICLDIATGKWIKDYDIDGRVVSTKLIGDDLLYFVSERGGLSAINILHINSGEIDRPINFEGNIVGPPVVYNTTLAVSINKNDLNSSICSIDYINGSVGWTKDVSYESFLHKRRIALNGDCLFYIDILNDHSYLNKVKIESGIVEASIELKDVYHSYMDFDGRNILFFGKRLYSYNTLENQIEVISEKYDSFAVINNGIVVYDDGKEIYSFSVNEHTKKRIFALGNDERFIFLFEGNRIFLVLADDVKRALADNLEFKYVVIKN